MAHQRAYWRKYPQKGQDLRFLDVQEILATAGGAVPKEDDWLPQPPHEPNLPEPNKESAADWLKRAKRLYESRTNGHRRRPAPRWKNFERHCDWFVQLEVLGWK